MFSEKADEQTKFRQIFESSRDAIMLIGPDGYIDCNQATLQLFDVDSKEKFFDLSPWKLSPQTQPDGTDSRQVAHEHINRALEEGEDFFEWTHRRYRGESFAAEVKLSRFELNGQQIVQALVRDITERKQRERKLRSTEKKLRREVEERKKYQEKLRRHSAELQAILNAMPDACFVIDKQGTYHQIITGHKKLLAAPPEELLGSRVDEQLPPEAAEKCLQAIERTLDFREVQEVEYRISVLAGEFDFSAQISPLSDDRVVFVARNITELKERERELQEIKNRLEMAVQGGNLGIWDWDMTTDNVKYNEQWARMLGYSPAQIEPRLEAWEKRVHPEDLKKVQKKIEAHIAGENSFYVSEQRMKTADGDWKWIRDVGKIFEWDEEGEPVRAVGIHIDIDERKRLERALREERDMFAEGPAVVLQWKNEEGWPVEYVSDNVEEVLGYRPEDLTSGESKYTDIIHDEDLERVVEEVNANTNPGDERFTHEPYRIVTPGGGERWVREHTKNIWRDGELTHHLGYLIDVTEQKIQERKIKRSNRELEQFAHKAAHDLKHPLSLITHSAEILELKNEDVLDADSKKYIDKITRSAGMVSNLLDELVEYARLESKEEEFEPVELNEVVEISCDNLRECIERTGAEVDYNELPVVEGNPSQLILFFQNLIDNAIKYRGEEKPEVQITAEQESKQKVKISVTDNGRGIEIEDKEKIFDIFYRSQADEEVEGTGIGLANCKKIIEQHGGEITVESSPGQGTTFKFTLPVPR